MRLFISLNPGESEKNEVERYMLKLKKAGASGNFSRRENLHITLAFIGETERTKDIERVMDAAETRSFVYRLSSLGRFKSGCRGDTVFISVEDGGELKELAASVSMGLKKAGFRLENRSFIPHLTIGRNIAGYDMIRDIPVPRLEIRASEIFLMKSERLRGILTYTPLYKKPLQLIDNNFEAQSQ